MSMIKCPECKKKISNQAKACPHCGAPVPETKPVQLQSHKTKRGNGCLISVLISICVIAFIVSNSYKSKDNTVSDQTPIVFDAARFWVDENGEKRPMHEQEVISLIGEPESIEEWNYKTGIGLQYPIRSLSYNGGKYIYEFNNDYLLRIQITEPFEYTDRKDFIKMFNLSTYINTTTDDNNINYRAYNCGVADLWLMDITDTTIGTTYITYFSGVFDSI